PGMERFNVIALSACFFGPVPPGLFLEIRSTIDPSPLRVT
ncbi:MAG: hypothetical protein ACI9HB_003323, partial [Gammaproteobacteria bacterium]